ncbi:transporter substrate-binding domain-containing protein [Amycolatopsis sp. NPDC059657]|uniref:transporter substrate-binding domain-containing protein n=1 Tax=Amycolatopsis sp. NPDC059657 TaxID=3346899 RepID=UPI00366C9C22
MKRLAAALALLAAGCSVPAEPTLPDRPAPQPAPAGVAFSPAAPPAQQTTCTGVPQSLNPNRLPRGANGLPSGPVFDTIRGRGQLVVGVSQTLQQLSSRNLRTGEMDGLEIKLTERIADAIFGTIAPGDRPKKIRYVAVPTGSRFESLDTKENRAQADSAKRNAVKVDMVIADATMTCQREQTYGLLYSSPYLVAKQGILVRGQVEQKPTDLTAFAGKKVCAAENTVNIARILQSAATPVSVPDSADCMVMLQRGQVDAVVTDDVILAGFAAQDGNSTVLPDSTAHDDPAGVAISNEAPDLVRLVNAVLEQMRADTSLANLYTQYFGRLGKTVPPPDYRHE